MTRYVLGDRVQLHPATDRWMQGDRYGEIVSVRLRAVPGPGDRYERSGFYDVKLDRSGDRVTLSARDIQGRA